MAREKAAPLVLGTLLLLAAALWASGQYTVPDPWRPYNQAVRDYLAAGLRDDTTVLSGHAASAQPAAWVREAARRKPAMVAAWARHLTGVAGERHGDTVAVVLSADESLWKSRRLRGRNRAEVAEPVDCSPLTSVSALLLNHSATPRLLAISSSCFDRQTLPVLRQHSILPH
jgi:hypothetical protein